jgi:hypothetical protein
MRIGIWWKRLWDSLRPARKLIVSNGESLPDEIPRRDVVLVRDDDEQDWSIGMRCPCGCGDKIELMVIPEAKPRWSVARDHRGRVSLHPSVWRQTGCRSHFWVQRGKIKWCD